MTTTEGLSVQQAMAEIATTERLAQRFAEVFETFDAGSDTFASDAFFDVNMPVWRFQLVGGSAFADQLGKIARGASVIEIVRTVPTISGFVTEHVERQDAGGEVFSARRLWLCEVKDGRISEVVGYCSGEWDEELRQRHARDAPMIR